MGLPIIQSLWIGDKLSLNEQLCIASFLYHGHEFHLYTYEKIENIPEGTILKDANQIIPQNKIFKYGKGKGSYAGFANWFRYKLLYELGGFWVDTDVVCMKPFQFEADLIFGLESNNKVNNAVMCFTKGHNVCSFLIDFCENPNKILPFDTFKDKKRKLKRRVFGKGIEYMKWGEAGPVGFTSTLIHFDLLNLAKPFTYFYPISNNNWQSIYDTTLGKDYNLFHDTYAIHLWNEMSRIESFDKNERQDKASLIEILRAKYLGAQSK
jgi:hypothetical protein